MKKIVILLFLINVSFISFAQDAKNIIIDATNYQEIVIGKQVQLVDVRTPEEYSEGYIDDAINIDYLDEVKFKDSFEKLDKNKPLYIYCRSGNRSQKSAKLLLELGFKEIYDLKGGYLAWSELKNY